MTFADTLWNVANTPMVYEDRSLIDAAFSVIPLDIYEKADKRKAEDVENEWGLEDYVIMELLKWFKHDFFKWVNSPKCQHCGADTQGKGGTQPSPAERSEGAGVTEIYECSSCHKITRFPRYGRPRKLLTWRQGRCGEWADCFTLLCRALGSDVRYIWNSEDHVWTEVYSKHQERWIHADSCEEAWDNPTLYEKGWGKRMAYCIAFWRYGATDVSKVYIRDESKALPRDKISENELAQTLARITSMRREHLSPEQRELIEERDLVEQAQIESLCEEPTTTKESLPRQSGSAEWTESRGENGL